LAVTELARREGATPFMVLLAGWQLLLARYSGQDDISIGSPIAGRTQGETEGLIGFFVNTLVLRTKLDGNPTFRELLSRVREAALGAYAHQEVPFEKLVEELQPERDLSRTALFQVMFTLQNTPRQELSLPGLTLRGVEAERQSAKFDLTLTITEGEHGLVANLGYNTDLFEEATAARMLGHLRVLLEGLTAHPDQRLSELTLLSESERHQLLVAWNDTAAPRSDSGLLHQLIAAQARRSPEVPAVRFQDTSLTFHELDSRANQLAHHLRALGVGPEVRVGLLMERSVEALLGLLAILKAGGAYVPMDPAYPTERLRYMLQDSSARVLLTQTRLAERLQADDVAVVLMDAHHADIARQPISEPSSPVSGEHVAYVIYTSGSTGRPKGVMVQHASVLNLLAALAETVYRDTRPPLRVSVNAPLSFDASVKQLIQLAHGHTLCVMSEEARADVRLMLEQVRHYRLDVLDCSPSHLRLLLEEGLGQLAEGIPQRVLIGGEAIGDSTWQVLA
ncbi:MAG: non-ribosomal peptide synthetase, partial [Archangium sp.]